MSIPYAPFEEFYLLRTEDETGTSGTGVVARGIIMPSGTVFIEWLSHVKTETRFNNIRDVELIHGHDGKCRVLMGNPEQERAKEEDIKKTVTRRKRKKKITKKKED